MNKDSRIYIAGHNGMVGSSFVRHFRKEGYNNLVLRSHEELELTDQTSVKAFFHKERPEYVILAAGKVGGIMANISYPAEFIYDNIQIFSNIIRCSWLYEVRKLLFIGSSCIYPRVCPQPMREEQLLTGSLEPTNEPFAVAKIAGIKMCQSYNKQYGTNFISLVATNLYGPGDDFHPETAHLVPGLIAKFHEAKTTGKPAVTLWGTGKPRREFMYVDDLSAAGLFLMDSYNSSEIINVGLGRDMEVREYAQLIAKIAGFKGQIFYDETKPDGVPRKLLDISKISSLGWSASVTIEDGIKKTYKWYCENAVALSI